MMYMKADGKTAWLKTATRMPYLAIKTLIDSSERYEALQARLKDNFEFVPRITYGDAFIIKEIDKSSLLLFCTDKSLSGAILLLGQIHSGRSNQSNAVLVDELFDNLHSVIQDIKEKANVDLSILSIGCEISICDC